MCLGKPKLPKNRPAPQISVPQQQPLENQMPQLQSGADQQNTQKQDLKKNKRSMFQFDLTIPVGAAGSSDTGSGTGSGVGAGGA